MSWWFWNNRLYTMGPQYTYKELDQKLKRYKKSYKREWMRADYMAYWRRSRYGIELRAGWRCTSPHHSKGERILLLYPRGKVAISANIGMPYERYRVNHYFPFNNLWNIWWWCDGLFLSRKGEATNLARLISPRYFQNNGKIRSRYIEFNKDGTLRTKIKGMRYTGWKRKVIRDRNKRNAPRKRGWYWTRRVRNIFRNHSKCISNTPWNERKFGPDAYRRYNCQALNARWESQPPQAYDCGCVTSRKAYKRKFAKTVKQILDEPNATVRAAWMQLYGIQKFFQDAGSTQIDHHGQYKLLRLNTGGRNGGEERTIVALKMECPSTKTVYINSVPDNISRVAAALDWMYDYRNYLGTVGQAT